ncbi:MAG TPA: methyltransferase domain-containing protein [Gemmatimonadaceae bacterium]
MTIPPLLCEHPETTILRRGYRAECGVCGSYWDLDSLATVEPYDENYPEKRGHFDPRVGALKVRTLRHWLDKTKTDIAGKRVCEVGFGGGSCLALLAEKAAHVIGLEINDVAIAHVRESGVRAELLRVDRLAPKLAAPVDLWLFQDSFEHIPDPSAFAGWMNANSHEGSEILIVLPRGDSFSRRLLGRLWPHKLPDHQFQWSRAGVLDFFRRRGWSPRVEFFPLKFASPEMVVAHGLHKLGVRQQSAPSLGAKFALPINFGEMGLVLSRRRA